MAFTQQHADDNQSMDERARELLQQAGWTLADENAHGVEWHSYTFGIIDSIMSTMINEYTNIPAKRIRQHVVHQVVLMRGEQRK